MRPQRVAYSLCSELWGAHRAYGHGKEKKYVPFNPKVFLATVNGGRSISTYPANQTVFAQGSSADAVFYIQKGKVKITVVSEQGKEAVVEVLGPDEFCGEGCLRRAAGALSDRDGNHGMRNHAAGESGYGPCPP